MKSIAALLLFSLTACTVGDDPSEDEEGEVDDEGLAIEASRYVHGVNGNFCIASTFNCRFREAGSRVMTAGGEESWPSRPARRCATATAPRSRSKRADT